MLDALRAFVFDGTGIFSTGRSKVFDSDLCNDRVHRNRTDDRINKTESEHARHPHGQRQHWYF